MFVVVAGYALAAVALVEALQLPARVWGSSAATAVTLAGQVSLQSAVTLWPALLAIGLSAAVWSWARGQPSRRRLSVAATVACAAAIGVYSYAVLIGYHRFFGYVPFVALWLALVVYLIAAHTAALHPGRLLERRALRYGLAAAGVIGFAVLSHANATRLVGRYPTLHVSLFVAQFAVLHGALAVLLAGTSGARANRVGAASAFGILAVLLAIGAATSLPAAAMVAWRGDTVLGRASVLGDELPTPEVCTEPPAALSDADAAAVFAEHSGLPALPPAFRIGDYNLLLVTVEATRFDQTSLAGVYRTTPNLSRLVERGAFTFSVARSPSSRTFLSIASTFAMTYPSHADITTMIPAYTGELGDVTTPAELLAGAGYHTFAFVHDRPLDYDPGGFEQGFAEFAYEPSGGAQSKTVDTRLVDRAIGAIGKVGQGQRFFGWVFLFSPHKPYEGDGQGSAIERQRGDIENADREIGRLIDALDSAGQLDRTVVVITSDHGEEFGEHGRNGSHGLTLYDEVVHVPLVVWLPGVRGAEQSAPTLTTYVLPWLLATGDGAVASAARGRIRDHFAPMMRATSGGVVVELIERYRMLSAIADGEHKVIYDFFGPSIEAFDLGADPGEQRALGSDHERDIHTLRQRIDRYRAIRACRERVRVTDSEAPRVN